MPNPIKYSTSAQTLALKKGNFWIGTGDVGKGPTSTTDYYNGITPPSGGYTIYLNKASGGPSIYTAANDSQLISLSNTIAGQTFATAAAALAWFATQTDKMVFNEDYPAIVTNGLILNLDAGFTPSYPTTGTSWYDVSSSAKTGTLINGPSYSSGSIVFDGTNDYGSISSISGPSQQTIEVLFRTNNTSNKTIVVGNPVYRPRISLRSNVVTVYYGMETGEGDINFTFSSVSTSQWYQLVYTYGGSTDHKCYLNTVEGVRTSNRTALNGVPNFTSLDLGNSAGSEGYFNGQMSALRLYDRVLSTSEIQQNYQAALSTLPILDFYSGSAVSVSLRLLSSSYSGSSIRVRRSSDNTEQDIGFVNGVLDTASLVAFCSSGNGFVSRWYNQGSAGSYFQNTTATEQPSIVTGGVVNTVNNKPSILFDGIDDSLGAVGFSTGYGSAAFSTFGVGKRSGSGKYLTFIGTYEGYSGVWLGQGIDDKYAYEFPSTAGPGKIATSSSADSTSNQLYLTGIFDGTNSKIYRNGSEVSSSQSSVNYDRGFNWIGRRATNPPNSYQRYMDGNIQEILSYTSDQTSNKTNIEASIKNYYGI